MNRNAPKTVRAAEAGFTLVEIMVVVVILGILATLASTNVFSIFGESQTSMAQTKVKMLSDSVELYRTKYRKLPDSLEQLAEPDDKGFYVEKEVPKDPWGNDYILRKGDRPSEFEVISMGPDGVESEDDISSKPNKDR